MEIHIDGIEVKGNVREYKIVYFGLDMVLTKVMEEDEYEERLMGGEEMLNEMSKEGWEPVTFLSHATATKATKTHAVTKKSKHPESNSREKIPLRDRCALFACHSAFSRLPGMFRRPDSTPARGCR
jgi:hypothetical protein